MQILLVSNNKWTGLYTTLLPVCYFNYFRRGKKNIRTVNKIPFVIIIGKQTTCLRVIN